jgi:cytochrome c-type biogenesis protein CcmE
MFCDKPLAEKSEFAKFLKKIKGFFGKRILMFRMMFFSSFILICFSIMRYSNSINYAKNITPAFFLNNQVSENMFYNLAGVVKPGTINYIKGTDEISFIVTDFDHELRVFYKGSVPNNFVEGGTVIATGCIIDKRKPNIFMSNLIKTDHGYNSDNWLSKYSNILYTSYFIYFTNNYSYTFR